MIRRAAAIAFALTVNPALLYAQNAVLTVTVPSAEIYQAPSNVTPVIGHLPRGTVLPIARNLGSWVKIAWPDGRDGFGYVHVTMGRIGSPTDEVWPTTTSAPRSATTIVPITQGSPSAAAQPTPRQPISNRPAPRVQGNASPASHLFGVGGLVGYSRSIGVTTRGWTGNGLGIQFAVTRNTLTNDLTADQLTTTQLEPGIMFGLFDRITDYVWLRPYVGSTLTFRHASASAQQPVADNSAGFRVFIGAEFTFSSAPQFGVSADLGYRRFAESIAGFDDTKMTVAIAGHWYIR
jgi:hypothetical protein